VSGGGNGRRILYHLFNMSYNLMIQRS